MLFFLYSSLKINVQKSKLLGIWVSDRDVAEMAHVLSCRFSSLPFFFISVFHWDVICHVLLIGKVL